MSDRIVKREEFFSLEYRVRILTCETSIRHRYFAIVKGDETVYTSPDFYGATHEDAVRNCDAALQVVRKLLADTQFLTGEVVGA